VVMVKSVENPDLEAFLNWILVRNNEIFHIMDVFNPIFNHPEKYTFNLLRLALVKENLSQIIISFFESLCGKRKFKRSVSNTVFHSETFRHDKNNWALNLLHVQNDKNSNEKVRKIDPSHYERFYLCHLFSSSNGRAESLASKASYWDIEEETLRTMFKGELLAPRATIGISLLNEFCVLAENQDAPLLEKFIFHEAWLKLKKRYGS